MKNSNFEDIFKNSGAHDREFDFQESSWKDLEKRLEEPKKRRRFLWIWFLAPAILVAGFYGNIMLSSNAELAEAATQETTEDLFPKKTKANQTIKKELNQEYQKPTPISLQKNNNTITSYRNLSLNEKLSKEATFLPSTKTNTNFINSSVSKVQNSSSNHFTSVEDNILQPKNIKQHQQSTLSKEEPNSSETIKVTTQKLKTEEISTDQKSNVIFTPKALNNDLESLGLNNTLIDAKIDITPRDRKWEVGLTVGFPSVRSISFIVRLTPDISLAPAGSIPTTLTNHTGTSQNLYSLGFENNLTKRIQPLYRLNVGRESKRLLIRGGLILMRDTPPRKGINKLLEENPYDYSLQRASISNYWLLDLGIHFHLRSNQKKLRPYLGLAPMFIFHHTQKNINNLYFNDEKVEKEKITNKYPGLNFAGLNAEGGIKYKITPRIDLGISAYMVGFPSLFNQSSSQGNGFSKPQIATSISFKL